MPNVFSRALTGAIVPFIAALACAGSAAAGHGDRHSTDTAVSLTAQAEAEIDNDTMRAVLYTETEDAQPGKAADAANRTLAEATRLAKTQAGVKVRSGSYQTYPVYDKQNRIARWRVRAEVWLESADFKAMATLLSRLQTTMNLGGVEFFVSDEARRRSEDELTTDAIGEFRRRAGVAAAALGRKTWRVRELVVSPEGGMPPMPKAMLQARAASAMADVAPPPMEAGTSRLAVVVQGTISLDEPADR
jgi:predicted secreted protein